MKIAELWGGVECTVNRVGDRFTDQLKSTGHHDRDDDIACLASLGLSAVRYPVLWERVCRAGPGKFDWNWSDRRLAALRDHGVRPIVGLVHHGSGPAHTSLVDDGFAPGLARFAGAVADRYPWVEDWTPVNEPLTTARFSALYGHWYPHTRDERLFWLALLNQVDGVREAMHAIRKRIPHARLIQTDDLGRTYATVPLADQAAFDNVRRWMAFDLLFGRVVPGHDLWTRLCGHGFERRLRVIANDPCPPDIVGINHYLTSDRFLDHRIARYRPDQCGSNGSQVYADVEAVRVLDPPPQGLSGAIREAWDRYCSPLALTEVHNGCTREEQVRWLRDAWQAAEDAAAAGVDVRAVTSWALFGSRGWDTLLTAPGRYEAGAFDAAAHAPRPTAVARVLTGLPGTLRTPPAAAGPGWWQRASRLTGAAQPRPAPVGEQPRCHAPEDHRPLLIAGGSGTLGMAMARTCAARGIAHVVTRRAELDLLDPLSIELALSRHDPWGVVNCAGWVRVDDAEAEAAACRAVNAAGASALATACAARGIATVAFSSDLVFDGAPGGDYLEKDPPRPLNVYGDSKARMERALLALPGSHLVVRTAAFFSPHDAYNFAVHVARGLDSGEPVRAASDQAVSPTYVPDLCEAVLDLIVDGETGLWHLTNGETLTWAEFGMRLGRALGHDEARIEGVAGRTLGWRAKRPRACGLQSERGMLMPSLQTAIDRFAHAYCHAPPTLPETVPEPVQAILAA